MNNKPLETVEKVDPKLEQANALANDLRTQLLYTKSDAYDQMQASAKRATQLQMQLRQALDMYTKIALAAGVPEDIIKNQPDKVLGMVGQVNAVEAQRKAAQKKGKK